VSFHGATDEARTENLLLDARIIDEHVEAGVISDNGLNQKFAIRLKCFENSASI
jgi:hypothetical protein